MRSPVGIHLVDRVVAVPSADEGEVGPRLIPPPQRSQAKRAPLAATSESERTERKATEDRRDKEARSLVRERLDAEVLALEARISGELRRRGFCRDTPADHDELALGKRRRDTEVLLDEEDGKALFL